MAKSRHTPAPWSYNERSPSRVTAPGGETIAATYGGQLGFEEQVSNTRLLASAPVMYEYIVKKAAEGDEDAKAIIARVDGSES